MECTRRGKIKRIKRLIEELNIDSNSIEKIREYNYQHELSRVDKVTKLSILYSQPKWMVKYLLELLKNPVECEELLKRLNEPPTIWIRANTLKIKVDDLINILRRRGVRVIKDKDIPYALKVVKGGGKLTTLPEYKQGLYYIQDKSSMIVIHNLKPGENAIIYDLCSAPGGKASLIIQLTNGNVYLVGVDISLHRIKVEKIMLNRLLGPRFIGDLIQGDSTTHLLNIRRANIVLVDPDCSALGKLGHSPEIRLWIRKEHIKHFMNTQINY